jgi:hypothetical protein
MALTYINFQMIEQPIEELSATKFQTSNLVVQALTADSIKSNYNVAENVAYDSKVFTNEDSSKAFHFDTGFTGPIEAVFPNDLLNGFNVAILNVDNSSDKRGADTITLVADTPINTINGSQTNSITNTGILIYKYNNELYGVGTFD